VGAKALMTQSTTGSGVGLVPGGFRVGKHRCVLHMVGDTCTYVDGSGHGCPPLAAGTTTDCTIICTPPPHATEQLPDTAGLLKTQSTGGAGVGGRVGHTCVLHATDCTLVATSGHALPPLAAGVSTARAIICTPPPHVTEQLPEGAKSLMTQLCTGGGVRGCRVGKGVAGHACVLHAVGAVCTFNEGGGHAWPPLAAGVTTVRAIICTPPPQTTEQLPWGTKSLMTQSTAAGAVVGHACVLHGSGDTCTNVDGSGHAWPPWAAAVTTVRNNICTPPPHAAEHAPCGLKPLTKQSTGGAGVGGCVGHTCVLHATDCTLVATSGHAVPPLAAGVSTERACICTPPPQATEQLPVDKKALMTQFCTGGGVHGWRVGKGVAGHACVLHGVGLTVINVDASGHAAPPYRAGETM
jgi:hypothetical protein